MKFSPTGEWVFPNGTVSSNIYDTPLEKQNLIGGDVLIDEGVDGARVIAPNDIWRSILFMRVNTLEAIGMPPLAHNELDRQSFPSSCVQG